MQKNLNHTYKFRQKFRLQFNKRKHSDGAKLSGYVRHCTYYSNSSKKETTAIATNVYLRLRAIRNFCSTKMQSYDTLLANPTLYPMSHTAHDFWITHLHYLNTSFAAV